MPIAPEKLADLIDRQWWPLVAWLGENSGGGEDIVQQAFVALASQEPAPDHPVAWLYRVARNRMINSHRKQTSRKKRDRTVAKTESVVEPVERTVEAAELLGFLQNLPEQQREIVVARIWGQFSFEEIGQMIGSSKATVWRKYEIAIASLRQSYGVTLTPNQN